MTLPAVSHSLDLDGLRQALLGDDASGRRPIGLRRVEIGPDALQCLVPMVEEMRRPGPIVVVMDATAIRRQGEDAKALVVARLAAIGATVTTVVLGDTGRELHADAAAVDTAAAAMQDAGCVVAVGSGTVCDVAKEASNLTGRPPFVVVQTACSVNAFSDDMAVLLVHGVKRTVPSRWPDALLIDLTLIAEAPAALNRAGVGELVAMFTAPADWRLAEALEMDATFDLGVVDLFRASGSDFLAAAPGIAAGEHEALDVLSRAMTLSGIALGVAGRTSPISGAEHTVSHLLDMAAARSGTPTGLHGAQVGVAAVVIATLWQRLLETMHPEQLTSPGPTDDEAKGQIDRAFGRLDPTGEIAAECWREYRSKLSQWRSTVSLRAALSKRWPGLAGELRRLLGESGPIVAALQSAGAPVRFSELDPGIDRELAHWALGNAHLMRDRFTVLDLAAFVGVWRPSDVDDVLDAARFVGGGL